MRNYKCTLLCLLFLYSCANSTNNKDEGNKSNRLQHDSLETESKVVKAFNKLVLDCQDSISKYNMGSINDTCLKYIYVIYGAKRLKKYNLPVAECGVKLTELKKVSDYKYHFSYTLFIEDSIPIITELSVGALIHSFEYDSIQKKIIKAYLGQHDSYMDEYNLRKLYLSLLLDKDNRNFFTKNPTKLHPDALRLVLGNVTD